MAWSLGSLCPSRMTLLLPREAARPPQAVRPCVSSSASCVLGRSPGPHGSVGKVCQRKAAPPQQPGPGTLSVSPSPGWVVSNQTKEEKNEQVWTAE